MNAPEAKLARVDLHTHSRYSDGLLSPAELVGRAAQRAVALLALTDHDTTDGCAEAHAASAGTGVQFITGIELTCQWREREIHVVGLRLDPAEPALQAHCAALLAQRRQRIEAIGERLTRAGLPGAEIAAEALAARAPTRMHVARALSARGFGTSAHKAFERYLARGRAGHARADWPPLEAAVARIVAAGGTAVLAHPHRYRFSNGALRELAAAFKGLGGAAIEVSLAGMSLSDADRAAALARRYELAGSIGSDFHEPDLPWRPLGRFAKLPEGIMPVMACLGL